MDFGDATTSETVQRKAQHNDRPHTHDELLITDAGAARTAPRSSTDGRRARGQDDGLDAVTVRRHGGLACTGREDGRRRRIDAADEGDEGAQLGEEALRALQGEPEAQAAPELRGSHTYSLPSLFYRGRATNDGPSGLGDKDGERTPVAHRPDYMEAGDAGGTAGGFRLALETAAGPFACAPSARMYNYRHLDIISQGCYYLGATFLHAPDIPLHALPLRLARRQQVAPSVRMRKGSEGEGKGRKGTHNVGDVAVPLKLVADVAARLGAGPGVGDVPRAAQDGAVEGEDAGALEELLSGGGVGCEGEGNKGLSTHESVMHRGRSVVVGKSMADTSPAERPEARDRPATRVPTRRKPRDGIATANGKSNEEFLEEFIHPSSDRWPTWRHPKTGAEYTLGLLQPRDMTDEELDACFDLVEKTSGDDYRSSSVGWHPAAKKKEMRLPDLRYILVKDSIGQIRGFTSMMPTYENGEPVVYCYEIHLEDELQGTGLGKQLMGHLTAAAEGIPSVDKAMLTCFAGNARARAFYEGLGFGLDESSPRERRLRGGKVVVPDYVILSRGTAWARASARTRTRRGGPGDDADDVGEGEDGVAGR
ncbi:hypothetical protein Purlil1_3727 [Purpureocillium lilacinum]|uniref:N-alpha-acetyltransferase 40 n=1 Tax=Purpureocillium lilacinum TaxID=33203 RepID=A0ABR0C689_PURLI|nr:hypothetical protein Purlil1_3727 [Purpureocillium lilacinum]